MSLPYTSSLSAPEFRSSGQSTVISVAATGNTLAEKGFYVRAWTRDGSGTWAVALDVTQPQ